jgi:hypothetical protein
MQMWQQSEIALELNRAISSASNLYKDITIKLLLILDKYFLSAYVSVCLKYSFSSNRVLNKTKQNKILLGNQ